MSAPASGEILIVEDNPNDLELTLRALRRGNPSKDFTIARDGEEALELLRSAGPYKAILLDLKLPKLDGKEVLKRLKSDERTKSIPVIVLTSPSFPERSRIWGSTGWT
jgi:two-component system, response regulator